MSGGRWKRLGWVAMSAAVVCVGSDFAWRGATHRGVGVWSYGGGETIGGGFAADEHTEVVSEGVYRHECYLAAGMFFVVAAGCLWNVVARSLDGGGQ